MWLVEMGLLGWVALPWEAWCCLTRWVVGWEINCRGNWSRLSGPQRDMALWPRARMDKCLDEKMNRGLERGKIDGWADGWLVGLRVQLPTTTQHPNTHQSYLLLKNKCLHWRFIWLFFLADCNVVSDPFHPNDLPLLLKTHSQTHAHPQKMLTCTNKQKAIAWPAFPQQEGSYNRHHAR